MEFFDFESIKNSFSALGFFRIFDFLSDFYEISRLVLKLLVFVFFAGSIFIFIKMFPLRSRLYVLDGHRAYKAPKKQVFLGEEQKRINLEMWNAIIKKAETMGSNGYTIAVIEADIMLEKVMGRIGFLGKNLAERLRTTAPGELPNLDAIWDAHKLRNRIAHEPDFRLTKEETLKALGAYKKAMQDLKVL